MECFGTSRIVQLFLLHGFLLFHDCPENIINLSLTHAIFTAVIFGRYFILDYIFTIEHQFSFPPTQMPTQKLKSGFFLVGSKEID